MYETVIYKIYMYVESTNELVDMKDECRTFKEAMHHCRLYFDKNPHDYLLCRYKPHTGKATWHCALNYM